MRILVVEDEEKLARYLKKGLEESSYVVDLALNGTDGLHLATHETYVQNHREFKMKLIDIDTSTHYTEHCRRLVPCEEELISNSTHNRNHMKTGKGTKTS